MRRGIGRRQAIGIVGAGLLAAGAAAAGAAPPRPAALPVETLATSTLEGVRESRVYVSDIAINHIADGRVRVYDAVDGRLLGMIPSAYAGNFTLSDRRDELYLATTHLSRSSRGERTDVLEVHDTRTLGFKYEVVLPPKRAQSLNYRGLVRSTGNGRFVLVQNATPATSVTVVDLTARQVAAEVPTPGCWGVLPAASHAARFSMLCGDGSVATVTLGDDGRVVDRQSVDKVFDPDADPWFHHAEQVGDHYWFLSFAGRLTELDLGGPAARTIGTRDLVSAADRKAGWRPGGYQNFAVDPTGRWLVAGMHPKGGEGTHKTPAARLWVVDLQAGRRTAVLPGGLVVSLGFSRNGERLHALDVEKGALRTWAWREGHVRKLAYVPAAGEASLHLESHD